MKLKLFLVLAVVLIFVSTACQGNQTAATGSVAAKESAATNTAESTIVPPTMASETPALRAGAASVVKVAVSPPTPENLTIEAADGLLLHATYSRPGGSAPFPGVILLHMLGSNRQVWEEVGLTDALVANGYAVLALDIRGHGESGGERKWEMMDDDVLRVWSYFAGLQDVDENRTAVIGASIGSNLALRAGANEPAIKTIALLSPGLDYRRITTDDAIARYGSRPVLIVASQEDGYAADSSQTLAEMAQGEADLQLYDGAGHGTGMFGPQSDLTDLLLDWLDQYLAET